MFWNKCLYQYHKKYGGSFLGGEEDNGLLILTWKDRALAVDLYRISGRYGTSNYVQARIPVTLAKPYKLTVGAEKALSGGVNTVLKAVPGLPDHAVLPADFGFPEVTKRRLIRSDNHPFTKLVLGSLDLRNALQACPGERLEVRPGPGEEGLHLITVTTAANVNNSDWYLGEYEFSLLSEEERVRVDQRIEAEFFPKMDRFLDLARAACGAVTQWAM